MSTTQPIRDARRLQKFKEYYALARPDIRNYTLCILGLNTALRITDLLRLKWQDIYSFEEKHFFTHLIIQEQKTGKCNTILLNSTVTELLTLYRERLPLPPGPNTWLFASKKEKEQPLSRYQAYRIVKAAALYAGLERHVSCHSLRKTFGYHAWQQGAAPALLMNIYNHSSYQITKRYLGIEQDDKDKIFMNISI